MAGIYFGNGSWFAWGGIRISELLTFEWTGGSGEKFEVTNRSSRVVGSGAYSRVVKEYDTVSIEPMKLTLTFYGAPPAPGTLHELAGHTDLLTCGIPPNHSFNAPATLDDWNWGCDGVATPQRGTMVFTFGNY